MRNCVLGLLVICWFCSTCSCQPSPPVLVQVITTEGVVKGRPKTAPGGSVYFSFTGIPYASAPVGPFRFKPPSPPAKRNGPFDSATRPIPTCMHFDPLSNAVVGIEDCLVVNVFTPADLRVKPGKDYNFPVMVWIHGGGFIAGSSRTDLFSPGHFVARGVIMVSINYRLSSLGFLSTEDAHSPGNYGILDQIEALKWVQKNIEGFGGDPNKVTIVGVSAGGASVHNLVLSPLAQGLFKYAISQSGTSLCPWAFEENAAEKARKLADVLNCPTDSAKTMMHCLRMVPAEDVVKAAGSFLEWFLLPLTFTPVVDAKFSEEPVFPKTPIDLLTTGEFNRVPWITGVTTDEGYCMSWPAYMNATAADELQSRWESFCPTYLDIHNTVPEEKKAEVCAKAREYYFGDELISATNLDPLTKMSSARHFVLCGKQAADLQSKFSPVYFYSFEFEGELGWMDLVFLALKRSGRAEGLELVKPKGVAHADDMLFMFDMEVFMTVPRPEPDRKVLIKFMDMWTNFAKYGDPTPDDKIPPGEIKWPKYEQKSQPKHLVIDAKPGRLESGVLSEREEEFWNSLPIEENIPHWDKDEL